MDERLQALRRAYEADPPDGEAARRYEGALRRAGQRGAVRELYRLKFQCDVPWAEMAETAARDMRRCGQCERAVHFVRTPAEYLSRAAEGSCVAFLADALPTALDAPEDHPARAEPRRCLLPLAWPEAEVLERARRAETEMRLRRGRRRQRPPPGGTRSRSCARACPSLRRRWSPRSACGLGWSGR